VPEGIKITKGKNIYVMLGINSLRDGIGLTILGMENLIREIKKVAPNCNIIIQSVTPITKGSNITSSEINNTVIEKYNKELRKLCQNKNLYYIDVAEAFKDSNGFLKEEYCSDTSSMGIHFTNKGAEKWAEYLKNHVPCKLKE
jgi:lysophospholipase L1-like esterase